MPDGSNSEPRNDSFLGVKMPNDLKRRAEDRAHEKRISVSELTRRALRDALDDESEAVPA